MKKCYHFEWIDEYVDRIQFEGYVDSSVAATWELNLGGVPPIAVENTGSSGGGEGRVVPMAMYARNAELHGVRTDRGTEEDQETSNADDRFAEASKYHGRGGSIVVSLLCFSFTCYSSIIRMGI